MQEGIIILSDILAIQDFNPAAAGILNLSPLHLNQDLKIFLNIPQSIINFTQQNTQHIYRTEIRHQTQYLLITFTRLNDEHSAWLVTIVDITETRDLEQKLAEQDKLASLGQMASMLAHEIRNPMQSIAQAVELMGLQDRKSVA